MTIEEIRKGAPLGATHYSIKKIFDGCYYFRVINNDCHIWTIFKRWESTIRKFNDYNEIKPL